MEALSLENLEFSKILAAVAAQAGSAAGKETLLALAPATTFDECESRLCDLDEVVGLFDRGRGLPLGGIRELRDVLERLTVREEILCGEELQRVRADIEVLASLRRTLAAEPLTPRLGARLQAVGDLEPLRREIVAALKDDGELRDDASPRLSRIRRDLRSAREETERRLGELLQADPDLFSDRFFTLRSDRYVLPVKAEAQSRVEGIVHDQSGSGRTVFLEPLALLAHNNRLSRLRAEEREEIRRIMLELSELARARQADLAAGFALLVFADTLLARARYAHATGSYRPLLAAGGALELRAMRHPLLLPGCVANDLRLEPGQGLIVITGPNAGGKTVTLKTVGLNVLLAQCGCYVLAAPDARLPIFTEVLADIGEAQSVEAHLSTFTSHLTRLAGMLAHAGPGTLFLLDELGVGTDPVEGAALATAVLKFLRARGAYGLVTSHYDALKRLGFSEDGIRNASMEFDEATRQPTYRFLLGLAGRSNALAIARSYALPPEVLGEMERLLAGQGEGGEEARLLAALEHERLAAEAARRDCEERSRALAREEAVLRAENQRLAHFRRTRRDALVERIETELTAAVRGFETTIAALRRPAPPPGGVGGTAEGGGDEAAAGDPLAAARAGLAQVRALRDRLGNEAAALGQGGGGAAGGPGGSDRDGGVELAGVPQLGESVRWGPLSTAGVLVSADAGRDRAVVEIDGKYLNVPLSQLRRIGRGEARREAARSGGGPAGDEADEGGRSPGHAAGRAAGRRPGQAVEPIVPAGVGILLAPSGPLRDELDLRGLRVEEALEKVQHYLPQAEGGGLGKVRLIHGKGTGALQRAVHDWLKASRWAKKFRFGRYGEGDLGVTVVVFDPSADPPPGPNGATPAPAPARRPGGGSRPNRPGRRIPTSPRRPPASGGGA